jgi:hypothetical protein
MSSRWNYIPEQIYYLTIWGTGGDLNPDIDPVTIFFIAFAVSAGATYWWQNLNFDHTYQAALGHPRPFRSHGPIDGYLTGFYTNHNLWHSCYLKRTIGGLRRLNRADGGFFRQDLIIFYREYSSVVLDFQYTHPASTEFILMCSPLQWA